MGYNKSMTGQEIITKFELYMDDTTELSSDEELDLLNKVYQEVSAEKPWESLKKAHSATADGTVNVSLPTRFQQFVENYNYSTDSEYANGPVVFIGSNYEPYKIISFSDRRQYRDHSGYAYLDLANSNLVFTVAPSSGEAVEFDYIETPADLTTATSPWIPDRFQHILFHKMCVDDFIIQQSEKARSYKSENEKKANDYLESMGAWNARLIQM